MAMDAAAVQALVESTKASAEAVAEVVQALKAKFTEERKDKFSEASKVVRHPEVFQPSTLEEEHSQWQDWRLTFRSWLIYAQEEYEKDLNEAEAATAPMEFLDMSVSQHQRAEKLHSILVGLLRHRPLKILRSVEGRNGLEVWRILSQQMQPKTRARSIALLQAFLGLPPFKKEGVLEQILGMERLADEYAQVSKEELSDNTKLSVLLRVVPAHLRQHLQLQMSETSDYQSVREKVLAYERTTTSWSSSVVYRELNIKKDQPVDESTPMEIDRIKGKNKGKSKGKSKGFGKDVKGKGKSKDYGKSKSKDKGKGKDYGKSNDGQGKGKGLPRDMCKLCGARGHWSRECPTSTLRQVTQDSSTSVATQSLVGSVSSGQHQGGVQGSPSTTASTAVRRITYINLDDEEAPEEPYVRMINEVVYDMTYSDSDDDWCICIDIKNEHMAVYFEDFKKAPKELYGKNLDGGSNPQKFDGEVSHGCHSEQAVIRGVTMGNNVSIILDSGADMSVLPLSYKNYGKSLSKTSVLRDAQGNRMPGGSLRQAVVTLEDDFGNVVELRETFALSNVSDPLLALGKMLKRGWKVEGDGVGVRLVHGDFNKSVGFRSNSLALEAEIRMVGADLSAVQVPAIPTVRQVTMSFEGMMNSLLTVPGWHLSMDRKVPFLVVVNSNQYKDSYPQFNRNDFPLTIVLKGRIWEVVEVAEESNSEGVIPECEGELTTVVSFFHKEAQDVNTVGTIHTGSDDPFLQPLMRPNEPKGELAKESQGFGWHGKTLEDGVYEVDDDEDMGPQPEAGEADPLHREVPQRLEEEDPEEIDIEGEKFAKNMALSKLRVGLKMCGLPKGRSKADAWKRLLEYHRHFADNLAVELAQREFERKKVADGGGDARGQAIPRMPTKAERQVHELTHWPYAEWCESCVAARARSDPHRLQTSIRAEGKSEYPVVSMDFCYTRGLEEPEEIDKEDLRLYGGDVKGGMALIVTDDWTRSVMALPTPGKSRRHAKFLAEQVVRYIGACGFSTCIVTADGEPSTRLLVDIIQKCRQKLGFKTLVEHSGPGDSQGNGRAEREIQTVRGLARTLMRRLSDGAGVKLNCQGPIFQWAMRHSGWLITHFRRHNGSPTAYEQITGRKYQGKLAIFGERVRPAVWLGKTDRADFHIVATSDGLRWTRTIRRMPVGFDATILNNVRVWPWNVSFGQIGTKSTPLMLKTEEVPLPPDLAGPLRLQERQDRQQLALENRQEQQQPQGELQAGDGGDQRQAGTPAASDPSTQT
eukprot:s939_g15.t1